MFSVYFVTFLIVIAHLCRFVQVNKLDGFSCTVKITHNLVERELVSPKVYLARGTTRTPPPYKIAPGYEDADKKMAVFYADDKITKADFASKGCMSYDVDKTFRLVIVWDVVKHGTFLIGEGKNYFYFALLDKNNIKTDWKTSLKAVYDDAHKNNQMYDASTTGRFVELVNTAADGSVDFTIRTQMTNDKNAQLILTIDDPKAVGRESEFTKRALATPMGMGALFTVVGSLSKMALRHLPTDTQSIVVTVKNDFTDTSLEDPTWSLKQTILFDSIPYEIPAQESRQFTFKIPLGYAETKNPADKTKHSAIFVSYRIKGTDSRLTFTIWWGKKLKISELNNYSVSLRAANISPTLIENILKNRLTTGGYQENVLVAKEYLDYQCKENEIEIIKAINGVQTKAKRIVRMLVTMGDSTASNMILSIEERKGNKFDIIVPSFQSCYEK